MLLTQAVGAGKSIEIVDVTCMPCWLAHAHTRRVSPLQWRMGIMSRVHSMQDIDRFQGPLVSPNARERGINAR